MKQRVLSGIRATGRLHLGNYFGAVKGMLALQTDPNIETFYMVADIHTITTPYQIEELKRNRREVILDYISAGLDPQKSVLFFQADSPHAELAFYLSSVISVARMQHLPTFKEKVKQYPDHATMALLNYPILMAADILIYKADMVPVGVDQEPHIEVAREIARKMNAQYGLDFPEPQRFATAGEYVPSLTGMGKMSKTVEGSYINLSDTMEEIKTKLARVPTDSGKGTVRADEKTTRLRDRQFYSEDQRSFGVETLMQLAELFLGSAYRREKELQYTSEGIRYGDFKTELAEAIFRELEPIQQKRKELEAQPDYVDQVIAEGAQTARAVAMETVNEVKQKMGLA